MCFKDKFGYRLIASRKYYGLSSHMRFGISKNTKKDRTLLFELVSESGTVNLIITNKNTKEEIIKTNMRTGVYEFKIKMNDSYQISFSISKATGSYKLRIG